MQHFWRQFRPQPPPPPPARAPSSPSSFWKLETTVGTLFILNIFLNYHKTQTPKATRPTTDLGLKYTNSLRITMLLKLNNINNLNFNILVDGKRKGRNRRRRGRGGRKGCRLRKARRHVRRAAKGLIQSHYNPFVDVRGGHALLEAVKLRV